MKLSCKPRYHRHVPYGKGTAVFFSTGNRAWRWLVEDREAGGEDWGIPAVSPVMFPCFSVSVIWSTMFLQKRPWFPLRKYCKSHILFDSIFFLLNHSSFTISCSSWAYNKVLPLYIYIHIYKYIFRFFSIVDYYKTLSRVPCAIQ